MSEERHRNLVWALRDRLPLEGIKPTHCVGTNHFPDPPMIDGHQPDLLGEGMAGAMVVGLAKGGADLNSEQAAEQYRAFANHRNPVSGERAALVLAVPAEDKGLAEEAINAAGVEDRTTVVGVGLPNRGGKGSSSN